jgi:hypothetical protein
VTHFIVIEFWVALALLKWITQDPIVFWLGCCCDQIVSKENGLFPVTYFETDTYTTFLNKRSDFCSE